LLHDVNDLKAVLDQIQIETAINSAHIRTLRSGLLDVCKALLPENEYKALYSNYLSELKETVDEALAGLDEVLFEPRHQLLRRRAENFFRIEAMRREENSHI